MPLSPGECVGPYEILSLIGEGGMEVAKANVCVGGTTQHTNEKRRGHIRLAAWQPVVPVSTNLCLKFSVNRVENRGPLGTLSESECG